MLESADKTNLARFFSEADWAPARVNAGRVRYMRAQTRAQRRPKQASVLVLDDTLCEHVGNLFEHVDRHDNHGEGAYPLAHNPVTSFYVSGAVRFPLDPRLYRRYEEVTQWETFVAKHFPERAMPTKKVVGLLTAQADATGLPLWPVPILSLCGNADYEAVTWLLPIV